MAITDGARPVTPTSEGYEHAILKEVLMLLDYVAGCPAMTIHNLRLFADPHDANAVMPVRVFLGEMARIEARIDTETDLAQRANDAALLLLARDALTTLINPASGLTVAYTAMVVGNRRGDDVRSRAVLAERAYAGLARSARLHRVGQRVLLGIALLITVVAVWDSSKVALGRSLLHNLADLRAKQAEIFRETVRLEASTARPNALTMSLFHLAGRNLSAADASPLTVRFCDRPRLLFSALATTASDAQFDRIAGAQDAVFESAEQQDVCDRDKVLAGSFHLAHQAINAYAKDWPAVAGGGFELVSTAVRLIGGIGEGACRLVGASCETHPDPMAGLVGDASHEDSELLIAPVLAVLGNYVLPVTFALLGAAAFVVLEFYSKLRQSLLEPRDHVLSWIRLVLGGVIGTCIGLFFSSYAPQSPSVQTDVAGVLTLTASGISFLAGFGVEGVFTMLGALVRRVFGSHST